MNNLRNLGIILAILFALIFFIYPRALYPGNQVEVSFMEDFRQVDDYPLFVAQYTGDYRFKEYLETGVRPNLSSFGCTCFAANSIVGRNFDFPANPALLLYTNPVDGYNSISMVDLGYFGYSMENLPVDASGLEETPYMPFDGMNEKGLVVTMAAVHHADPPENETRSVGEISAIRLLLDYAANVDEAIELLSGVNVVMADPPIHYLVADANGESVIFEFVEGEMKIYRSGEFGIITNFILTGVDLPDESTCDRYDSVYRGLLENELSMDIVWELLDGTSQSNTIWSCVYDIESLTVHIAMGRKYSTIHTFQLDP